MDKKNYSNTIGLQVESLFELAPVQAEKCFDESKLLSLLSKEEYAGLKRIIVTGCGDSYSAAGVMAPSVSKLAGVSCASPDPMEFCRFYTDEEILDGNAANEVLVIAISASGGSARIVEILERANAAGVHSMLITNNPQSAGAKAAKLVYCVETPELCNTPGLRSYFASLTALTALSSFVGVCKEMQDKASWEKLKQVLADYVKSYQPCYEKIEDQMFEIACSWKDFEKFEIIGDEAEFFSAQFVEEKFIECASVHASHVDSEDWCHINFFLREPEKIGTIFKINAAAPDLDRICESVRVAVAVGRPVLVVTDADCEFAAGAHVCRLPKAPQGYEWLMPLMDFGPDSLLAAYCAACADKFFFAGRYDFRTRTWKN